MFLTSKLFHYGNIIYKALPKGEWTRNNDEKVAGFSEHRR